jgi:hypothetical protein
MNEVELNIFVIIDGYRCLNLKEIGRTIIYGSPQEADSAGRANSIILKDPMTALVLRLFKVCVAPLLAIRFDFEKHAIR